MVMYPSVRPFLQYIYCTLIEASPCIYTLDITLKEGVPKLPF